MRLFVSPTQVKHMKAVSEHSINQTLPMRRHIVEIAELLMELEDPDLVQDPGCMKEIMDSMGHHSCKAVDMANKGKDKSEALAEDLEQIQDDYKRKCEEAKRKAEEEERTAKRHDQVAQDKNWKAKVNTGLSCASGTVPLSKAGVLGTAAVAGAEGVAAIPLLGSALTTTTSAGGFWGALGYTTVAFNPAALMVATAMAGGFGMMALKCHLDARESRSDCQHALESKDDAEKRAAEFHLVAKNAKTTIQATQCVIDQSGKHAELWQGIYTSAEQVAESFQELGVGGKRVKSFQRKMKQYSEKLLVFVKARL